MLRRTRTLWAFPTICASLALAACGGDDAGGGTGVVPTPTPSPTPSPSPSPSPTPSPTPTGSGQIQFTQDIQYGVGGTTNGDMPLLLDLYQTDDACTANRPTVVFVHGGGFRGGDKGGARPLSFAEDLIPRGFNVLSINYRLEGDAPTIDAEFSAFRDDFFALSAEPAERNNAIIAASTDTIRALRWIEAEADTYCMDPSKLAVWGSSAGAYTILQVTYGLTEYNYTYPMPLVAVDYWGGLFIENKLEAGEVPFFVLHGTADQTVSISEANDLTARADQVGVNYAYYSVTNGGHSYSGIGYDALDVRGDSMLKVTGDFIEAHLSGGSPVYESLVINP